MAVLDSQSYARFKSLIIDMTTDIIWKNYTTSSEGETLSDPYLVETFMNANRGILTFETVKAFPRELLRGAGVAPENIDKYATDKNLIPPHSRDYIMSQYMMGLSTINPYTNRVAYPITDGAGDIIEWVSLYEEQNPYYRMLNGLPAVGDTDYYYVTTLADVDPNTPVHELPYTTRLNLESAGIIDTILKDNPKSLYLKYIGLKQIPLYKARAAGKFDILWMNTVDTTSTIQSDFREAYQANTQLMVYTYYSDAFKKNSNLYDSFIAMCILLMSIFNIQTKYLNTDITRDFYDTESLRYIYESYGVPFYTEIPLEYQKRLIKSINRLITYKGSTTVFFDLFNLFDMGNIDIFSYYFTKYHRFDDDGNLIFIPKLDSDGNPMYDSNGKQLLDESSYDIKFSKVLLGQDPILAIMDDSNKLPLTDITAPDPYWVEDENVRDILVNSEYNYNESKYIGITSMMDLLQITYESAYLYKMILDNKEATELMDIDTSSGIRTNIFAMFIYLSALYSVRMPYEANISSELPITAKALGYNFKASLEILQNDVKFKGYIDSELEGYIKNMNINNLASVNKCFDNILEMKSYLVDKFSDAKTLEEYEAYRGLYNTLLTSEVMEEVYDLRNGNTAATFAELLSSVSPELYNRYISIPPENVLSEMDDVIIVIQNSIPSANALSFALGLTSSVITESLFKMLAFFKSAKVHLVGYNVVFQITERGSNFFKFIDRIEYLQSDFKYDDFYGMMMIDILKTIETQTAKNPTMTTKQIINDYVVSQSYKVQLVDYIDMLTDKIISINELSDVQFKLTDVAELHDLIHSVQQLIPLLGEDERPMYDRMVSQKIFTLFNDRMKQWLDKMVSITDTNKRIDDEFSLTDLVKSIHEMINIIKDEQVLSDKLIDDRTYILLLDNLTKWVDKIISIQDTSKTIKENYLLDDYFHTIVTSRSSKEYHGHTDFLYLKQGDKLEKIN